MIRVYCDICGSESSVKEYSLLQISRPANKDWSIRKKHLCTGCTEKVDNFLKQLKNDIIAQEAQNTESEQTSNTNEKQAVVSKRNYTIKDKWTKITDKELLSKYIDEYVESTVTTKSRISVQDKKDILFLYNDGASTTEIMNKVEVSQASVFKLTNGFKEFVKSKSDSVYDELTSKVSGKDSGKIIALYRAGWKSADISSEIDIDVSIVKDVIDYYEKYDIVIGGEE